MGLRESDQIRGKHLITFYEDDILPLSAGSRFKRFYPVGHEISELKCLSLAHLLIYVVIHILVYSTEVVRKSVLGYSNLKVTFSGWIRYYDVFVYLQGTQFTVLKA
jgi:hypothetical protein